MTTIYKWLRADGSAPIGSGKWLPGEWRSVDGPLIPCVSGLHLCRPGDLVFHIFDRLWLAEADMSEVVETEDKIVVRRARVTTRIETIDDCTLRHFAVDCAERVAAFHTSDRSREALCVARAFADGSTTKAELKKASQVAWEAARDAAAAAAWDAPDGSAAAAAWAVASGGGPGWAAWMAARAAARVAARVAAERRWQTARLFQYISHGRAAVEMNCDA